MAIEVLDDEERYKNDHKAKKKIHIFSSDLKHAEQINPLIVEFFY